MGWLVDTNVFLRVADSSDPNHAVARMALRKIPASGDTRCFATQNIIEFWVVATRPSTSRGGLGLSVAEADRFVRLFRRVFTLIPETGSVLDEWYRLVTTHNVSGVQAHDARLAALMKAHGITHILTFNTTDFSRYGITAVNPAAV